MRVPTNAFPTAVAAQLQQLTSRQAQLQSQAASGQRVTNPNDDPAAMGRFLNIQAEKQQLQQFAQTNAHAQAISQTTYSGASQLKSLSDRAGELSVLGSGVNSPDAYNAYAIETNQLIEQALQTANVKFSGDYVFGGVKTNSAPFTAVRDANGDITSISYDGAATAAQMRIAEGSTISPSTDGVTNQKFADFMNNLVGLRDAMKSGTIASVQTAHQNLQSSEDDLIETISGIGAVQTRLETAATQNQARFADLQTMGSRETDADLAQTIVKLTQSQTAYQAAMQSAAKIMQTSLLDYLR